MTQFVDNLVETIEDGAKEAARQNHGRPRGRQLLSSLKNARRILVSCHRYPDPDALGSAAALVYLLRDRLPHVAGGGGEGQTPTPPTVEFAVQGDVGGGINSAFTRHARLDLSPWDDARLIDRSRADAYDAVVLCDVQPSFPNSPLPVEVTAARDGPFPTAIVDHHRARGRRPRAKFVDIRTDVGATASIVFSYFMELDVEVPPDLAATMLYAIESDLAGAAGQPSDLDNAALSSLTLRADTRKLYRMRHVSLPQHYFVSYANALANAMVYDRVLFTHIGRITSLEKPAIIADFLLRYEGIDWAIVTACHGEGNDGRPERLIVSARAGKLDLSAGEAVRKAMTGLGDGGGHRTKAGGVVRLENGTPTELERVRLALRRGMLKAVRLPEETRGRRLIEVDCDEDGTPGTPGTPMLFSSPDAPAPDG